MNSCSKLFNILHCYFELLLHDRTSRATSQHCYKDLQGDRESSYVFFKVPIPRPGNDATQVTSDSRSESKRIPLVAEQLVLKYKEDNGPKAVYFLFFILVSLGVRSCIAWLISCTTQ